MLTLIIFVSILSLLILIHELGHFLVAKKQGVRVEEFGLGLPPRVIGKRVGETVYTLNLLPFGGFVKLTGEDQAEDDENYKFDPENFNVKTPFQRFTILVAGVTMNMLLTVAIYYTFFAFTGFQTLNLPLLFDHQFAFGKTQVTKTVITNFAEQSPLPEQGVTPGDALVEIDGVPVYAVADIRKELEDNAGKETNLTFVDLKSQDSPPRFVTTIPYSD